MRFRINFEYANGTPDSIMLEGETIEEIREYASIEMEHRGINTDTCWSEEVK